MERAPAAPRVQGLERRTGQALFRPGLPAQRVARWLGRVEEWFGPARRPLASCPDNANLALVPEDEGLVAKRLAAGTGRGGLVQLGLLRSRAERSFLLGLELEDRGLATPRVLACLEPEGSGAAHTYLLAQRVEAPGPWEALAAGAERGELSRALGRAVGCLHAAGLRHRDLKAPNLYVERSPEGGLEIGFFDLAAARRLVMPPRGVTVARDLGRLAASFRSPEARAAGIGPEDWRACLEAYREARPEAPALDRLLAATGAWAERKLRRNARAGRPLA